MGLFTRLASVWRTVAQGRRLDDDLDAELQAWIDEQVERRVRAGEPPAHARRVVLMDMGGLDPLKERVREVRMGQGLDETARDVVHAWRGFLRAPAFTLSALATLALGVAAATAIFSVAHALLWQPLPFRDASRLVFVWADQTAEGYPRAPLSGPELRDLDERSTRFDGFAAIWATTAALTGDEAPEQLRIGNVTSDFFSLLGADAALGRTFSADDESVEGATSILLSDALWRRRYGADPAIVGRRVDVNGRPTVVIGVMPAGFRLLMPPDAAVPDDLEAWQPFNRRFTEGPRGQRYLRVIGRMRPGVSDLDAIADVARVGREISAAYAFYGRSGRQFETVPLHVDAMNDVRRPLQILSAGVGLLLLIACINVGSLLVARAAARAREAAVRTALGAGRGRLIRQHLVEGLLLGGLGGVLGIGLGYWALRLLLRVTPETLGRLHLATLSGPVALASIGVVLTWMTLLAFGPVTQAPAGSMLEAVLDGRGHTAGRGRARLRRALTVAQLALSVVLVLTALLLARTVQRVQQADLGFDAAGVVSFRVALPGSRYATQEAFNAFSRRLQVTLAAVPGATAAATWSHAPYDHVPNWGGPYLTVAGADPSTAPQADYRSVSPGGMELLGVRLLDGRWFDETDDLTAAPVAIVDERVARRAWPGGSALGRRLAVDPFVTGAPETWATVVGVVSHVRHRSPSEEVRDQVYFTSRQVTRNPSIYLVKATGDPSALVPAIREAIHGLDPALPIYDLQPLMAYVHRARALRAFTAVLAAIFAAAALVLAAVGIHGVVAYAVTERRREFGVRRALGAGSGALVGLVVGECAAMTAGGLALGLLGAAAGASWLRTQLVGITPWDPPSIAATVGVLVVAALLACAVPVRRALRADPAHVLREA